MADQDPFASIGGGVQVNGGWIPKSMATPEQLAGAQPAAAAAPGVSTPAPQAQSTIAGQAGAASTYSATPGAAPTGPTSNQGTQDVVRNSYLERATQPATVDRNDPNVRAQSDAYTANLERQRRQYLNEAAEKAGPYGTGTMQGQERMTAERVGQQAGTFEAQLVGQELANRRQEIKEALSGLYGMVTGDQAMALQRELAKLDAQMKELGIRSGENIAGQELSLKDKLGMGGLNIDLMRLLQADRQFGDTMGFNVADREAYYNNLALDQMMRR